jgi:hypothetical protein
MIAAGMDWKKITEFIGHSDVRTTYNRYGKVVPEDLAPAAAQLEGLLRPGRARLESRPQAPERERADRKPYRLSREGQLACFAGLHADDRDLLGV